MVLPGPALAVILHHLLGHIPRLVVLIHGGVQVELLPFPRPGPQLLPLAPLVIADHGVGRLQDVPGGAVILLQADGAAAGILLLKGEDVFDGGPPEAVDGLVIIAHHAEVFVPSRQGGGQQILQVIGVLILVNEYIAEFFLVILPYIIKLLEQAHSVEDDVIKIQRVGLPKAALVLHIDLGDLGQAVVPRLLALGQILVGQLHGVLGPGEIAQHRPGRELLLVQIQVLQAVLDDPQGVVRVVDGEGGGEAQPLNIPAQDAHTGGVEGGGPYILRPRPQQCGQAVLQFPGCLVGKGDSQDGPGDRRVQAAQPLLPFPVPLPRGGIGLQKGQVVLCYPLGDLRAVGAPAIFHQVGDAVDEHGGLTASRPGQQKQRPLGGQHRALLLRVQPGKLPGNGRPARLAKSKFLFMVQHGISHSFIQYGIVPLYLKRGLRSTRTAHGRHMVSPMRPRFSSTSTTQTVTTSPTANSSEGCFTRRGRRLMWTRPS